MVTDHLLIRRVAAELDRALTGRRVRDTGLSDHASVVIVFGGRQDAAAVHLEPFATPPTVWLGADVPLALEGEPGWLRAAGGVIRGMKLAAVRARKGDRVIALEFGSRSRFGVAASARLIAELVPRFGNVVVLRDETVVAAAKTFSPADNQARTVEIGRPYEPPPLPAPSLDRAAFERELAKGESAWNDALRDYLPQLPRLVATSLCTLAKRLTLSPQELAAWFELQAAQTDSVASADSPVHVYRRDGALVQAHVVPLAQYDHLAHDTAPALLEIFGQLVAISSSGGRDVNTERRRDALARIVKQRQDALRVQLDRLTDREREIEQRDALRRAGEDIYAQLFTLEPEAQTSAKADAARLFERYRKANAALPHIARRRIALERRSGELETLSWEIGRADPDALGEIAADLQGKSSAPSAAAGGRRRAEPRAMDLPSGARVYVGRSPQENARVTFELARPNDLWFHARNVPGAHVVLASNGRDEPTPEDIETAAAIAAHNSRAREAGTVDVDYTTRKFVRKQRNASPGMVWYTDFKTIRVRPRAS